VNEIEQAAQLSIGRACGFAGFGIALTVLALSFEPMLAAKTGAVLSMGLTLTLLVFAYRAHNTPHQTTEVWLLIERGRARRPGTPAGSSMRRGASPCCGSPGGPRR
jgi:hypothetical protein